MRSEEIEISEREFYRFVENNLSQAGCFSCVILYESNEAPAWYTALRIGEVVTNYFKREIKEQVTIHLNLITIEIMDKLNEMEENDILLLTTDNPIIKSLTAYLVSEILTEKKNLIFISKNNNSLITPFKEITRVSILVNTFSKDKLNCVIEVSEKGEKDLYLTLPDRSLINKYNDLKAALLKESIRKQVSNL